MLCIVIREVSFVGRAPELAAIAAKAGELSGLTVAVAESGPEVRGEMFDLDGELAFACAPDEAIKAFASRPGMVRALVADRFGSGNHPAAGAVGVNEPERTQVIYLLGASGAEPTLLAVLLLALEALGGQLREPLPDEERQRYASPITEADLLARRQEARRGAWLLGLALLVMLPVLVPLWLLWLVLILV